MLWEVIATAVAGVGAGGMAFALRRLLRRRLPNYRTSRSLIPAFAALGMLAVQIYSEYNWFSHQSSLLPEQVVVVRQVPETSFWRPWSLLYPQTLRFLAVDAGNAVRHNSNSALVLADIYAFQRRAPAQRVRQIFHCQAHAWAPLTSELHIPAAGEPVNHQWHKAENGDVLLSAVCD